MFFPSRCIKIFFLLGNLYELSHATVEVSISRTWPEAASQCLLIGSNNTGEVQEDNIAIPNTLPDDLYWIGATVKQTAWFEFRGFFSLHIQDVNGTYLNNSVNIFYDCYSICIESENSTFFASSENMCYCFPKFVILDQNTSFPRVSYYLSHNRNPKKIKGSIRGDCLAFTKTKTEEYHEVLDCETSLPPLCRTGVGRVNSSWSLATNGCPYWAQSSFKALYRNVTVGGPWWTGIARISKRIWNSGSKDMPLFGCLAARISKSAISLQEILCDTELPSLCTKETAEEKIETKDLNDVQNEGLLIGLVTSGILVILTGIGAFFIVRIRKRMHNHGKHNGSLTDSEPVVTTGRPNSNYTNVTSEQVDSLPENDYDEVATADRPHSAYDILNPEQVNNLPENHYNELATADRPQLAYDILNPEEVNNLPENHYKELNTVHDYMEIIE